MDGQAGGGQDQYCLQSCARRPMDVDHVQVHTTRCQAQRQSPPPPQLQAHGAPPRRRAAGRGRAAGATRCPTPPPPQACTRRAGWAGRCERGRGGDTGSGSGDYKPPSAELMPCPRPQACATLKPARQPWPGLASARKPGLTSRVCGPGCRCPRGAACMRGRGSPGGPAGRERGLREKGRVRRGWRSGAWSVKAAAMHGACIQ